MNVREEIPADVGGIREVHCAAFGRDKEAQLVDRLRSDGLVTVSVVADDNRNVVGHVLFSELSIETKAGVLSAVALAPLAVIPTRQREGIAHSLVRFGLHRCREMGKVAVLVLGDPKYYSRFGFEARMTSKLVGPFAGAHWMGLELIDGALSHAGSLRYPDAFTLVD
jgi:putative acetyltransferase